MTVWIEPFDAAAYRPKPDETLEQYEERLAKMCRDPMEFLGMATRHKLIGLAIIHFGAAGAILAGIIYFWLQGF